LRGGHATTTTWGPSHGAATVLTRHAVAHISEARHHTSSTKEVVVKHRSAKTSATHKTTTHHAVEHRGWGHHPAAGGFSPSLAGSVVVVASERIGRAAVGTMGRLLLLLLLLLLVTFLIVVTMGVMMVLVMVGCVPVVMLTMAIHHIGKRVTISKYRPEHLERIMEGEPIQSPSSG